MLFQKLAIVATLTALVAAQDISQDDIPHQCTQVCAEVVTIARDCDFRNENDNAELQCICNAPNANTLIPACEACVTQYDIDIDDDDGVRDNDVRDVLLRCNFPVRNPVNAAPVASGPSSAASVSATRSVVVTTSGTVVVRPTNYPPQVTVNAARAVNAAPAMTAAAGMGLGALGLALGMV